MLIVEQAQSISGCSSYRLRRQEFKLVAVRCRVTKGDAVECIDRVAVTVSGHEGAATPILRESTDSNLAGTIRPKLVADIRLQ